MIGVAVTVLLSTVAVHAPIAAAAILETGSPELSESQTALPEPKLDGASAVYANVLPDVDLKLTLIDDDRRTVFKAPPARMWNSAGKDLTTPPAVASERAALDGTAPCDPAERASAGNGAEPGQADQVVRMDMEVGKGTLSIVPEADLLAVTWGESERTLPRSDGYEDYAWGNGDDDQGQGVGKCGTWNGYGCEPGYVWRLYHEFPPPGLKGTCVLDATFPVTEPWAFLCGPRRRDPRPVDLVRLDNLSFSTAWSSRPKEVGWMSGRHVSAGRGDLWSPGFPNAATEFHDNPERTNENLTPTVNDFAAGKFSRLTLDITLRTRLRTEALWYALKRDAEGGTIQKYSGEHERGSGSGILP